MSNPPPRPAPRSVPGTRRAALLTHLRESDRAMSVAELAIDIGLHQNTVRAHLDRLVSEGRVERTTERRATRGRPRELYRATGAPEPHEAYAQLAAVLAAQLESLGEPSLAIDAGRRWAQWEQQRDEAPGGPSSATSASDEILSVLRRTGFAPERADDGTILLHHCPFGAVAREHSDVVCRAHLGLIQGTLDTVSPSSRAELIPFADPQTCIVHLNPAP